MQRLVGCALALLASTGLAGAAETSLIVLSDTQLQQAGIRTGPVLAADDPAASGATELRLAGTVVVPNRGLRVISAPLAGILQSLEVNPLEEVRAGDPLVRLFSTEYLTLQQEYVAARGAEQVAVARAERDEALFGEGIIARGRLDETRAAAAAARASLREHRESLRIAGLNAAAIDRLGDGGDLQSVLTLTSPIAGTVMEQLAEPGARLEAGAPVLRVADTSTLWIELRATAAESVPVTVGNPVAVAGCPVPGRIIAVGRHLESASQSVLLRAEFTDPGDCLRPNQYTQAVVTAGRMAPGTLSVPAASLVRSLGRQYVFVREGAGFRPTAVESLGQSDDRVWIRGDIGTGAEVAVSGIAALRGAWIGLGPEAPAADAE